MECLPVDHVSVRSAINDHQSHSAHTYLYIKTVLDSCLFICIDIETEVCWDSVDDFTILLKAQCETECNLR